MPGQHRQSPLNHQATDSTPRRVAAWLIDALVVAALAGMIAPTQATITRTPAANPLTGWTDHLPRLALLSGDGPGAGGTGANGPGIALDLIGWGDPPTITTWSWSGTALWVMLIVLALLTLLMRGLIPAAFGGSTVGMRFTDLRVTARPGAHAPINHHAGLTQHVVRTVVGLIDLAPYVVPGLLGWLVSRRTPRHQRLGDLLTGTMIVARPRPHPRTPTPYVPDDRHVPAHPQHGYGQHARRPPQPPSYFDAHADTDTNAAPSAAADTAHTRTVAPIGHKPPPASDIAPPVPRSERPEPPLHATTLRLPRISPTRVPAPADANGSSRLDSTPRSDENASTNGSTGPDWSDKWQSWVYWDATTESWFRHDTETGRWCRTG